jgi:flagellar basal body rod protein FlgC
MEMSDMLQNSRSYQSCGQLVKMMDQIMEKNRQRNRQSVGGKTNMIQAFFSALSGFKSFQTRLSVGANNIANVNTAGFQAQKTAAEDLIYTDQPRLDPERPPLQAGSGVRTSGIVTSLEGGALEQTGRSEDAALMGEGFFAVQNADGEVFYTRNGNFHYEVREGVNYLATANGELVLDESLSPLRRGLTDRSRPCWPPVAGRGRRRVCPGFCPGLRGGFEEGESPAAARLAVFTFATPTALRATVTAASPPPPPRGRGSFTRAPR